MSTTEVIREGDLYTTRMGHREAARCSGLLVRFGAEVMIVPDTRLAGALNQLGGWRVKERHPQKDQDHA